jgi:LemA protein
MLLILTAVVLLLIIIFIGYFVSLYNNLVSLKNSIGKAWSNINVLLKQRHDELSKLLESVKGYMSFEKEVLLKVTEARSAYINAKTIPEKAKADNLMTSTLKSLFAVAENYPELKANEMFGQFQNRITQIESEIADRREFYNDSVYTFNTRIEQFPDLFIARLMNYTQGVFFKTAETDKRDVEVKF